MYSVSTRRLAWAGAAIIGNLICFAGLEAAATPTLQLNVVDGLYHDSSFGPAGYESGKETIAAGSEIFTLQAYARPKSGKLTEDEIIGPSSRTFYLSIALVPGPDLYLTQGNSVPMGAADYGSFGISYSDANGAYSDTIDVTDDLIWGTPPEADSDLQSHGIFDTYYTEIAFNFDAANRAVRFNSQTEAGREAVADASGTMFFQNFLIDTTNLDARYELHFDLYAYTCTGTDQVSCNVDLFAPFSHDAMSWPPGDQIPEPATLGLFGLAVGGVLALRRRRKT